MKIIPADLSARLGSDFLATRKDCQNHHDEGISPASIVGMLMPGSASVSKTIDVLDVEVFAEEYGLRLVKIGANSPLLKLATRGDVHLQGALEIGDRIVAINGKLVKQPADLEALRGEDRICELCIFDHRTHQTVSWELNGIDEQNRVAATE